MKKYFYCIFIIFLNVSCSNVNQPIYGDGGFPENGYGIVNSHIKTAHSFLDAKNISDIRWSKLNDDGTFTPVKIRFYRKNSQMLKPGTYFVDSFILLDGYYGVSAYSTCYGVKFKEEDKPWSCGWDKKNNQPYFFGFTLKAGEEKNLKTILIRFDRIRSRIYSYRFYTMYGEESLSNDWIKGEKMEGVFEYDTIVSK